VQIGGIEVEIVHKRIKNLHIGCYPPDGRVRVAAPSDMGNDAIRLAVLTKMSWIKRKQDQFIKQERQSPRRFVSGETHFLFGRPLRLEVQEWEKSTHRISRQSADRLLLSVPVNSETQQLRLWMNRWFKSALRKYAEPRIAFWADRMGVKPTKWGIRPMKTKWGSCNPEKGIVWLNTELAKKPERMIDYVIVHELAHFVSPKHDEKFVRVLDLELPKWRSLRRELNDSQLAAWVD